eukprot:CAMPEP_0183294196 /NCGR_PEP_ID=MMETSP0160_2-20130417/2626_1 /TAXON_ID=2839 ORGANISM="Odontella Sinensis, Strain Grunow 1884" /NCGR_SAMPLE_ID=MMETSP0160_2 /ASSEMBLY_ACC=CAM_ASM_000250 /LENGTH=222 /DNA_ID=CAMNT_0025455471 /DNA_START=84 /DNA_END=749 /DNA_ORIENTATION=-
MRQAGPVTQFACMVTEKDNDLTSRWPKTNPWTHVETGPTAKLLRTKFHMVSWEYTLGSRQTKMPDRPLAGVDWENPDVVSVYVTRDPMDRSLSGDGVIGRMFGSENERTPDAWKGFANSFATNNYALGRLVHGSTNHNCMQGEDTPSECVDAAKALLRRFTFVLDQACLGEGLAALGRELGLPQPKLRPAKIHASAKDRINNTELYDFIRGRMRRDIELYNW